MQISGAMRREIANVMPIVGTANIELDSLARRPCERSDR